MAPAASEFAVFRPRRVRALGFVGAGVVFVGFAVLSVALLVVDWRPWTWFDVVWMNLLGVLFSAALLRVGSIEARPDEAGLTVRNIVRTRRFGWGQILGVTFSTYGDDPWAILDLADGSTCAVMAIQHADGPRAYDEVARLRKLVTTWTTYEED
ncbi:MULTISPECIES: PH domain-containing protein [unclassified Brevibacterium]|uniref:PH domain-containing protein n=1 Tax=unclassified Brevibacterium TaxID=2614124 RepID=UPI0010F49725|nr:MULTISPECIES: PH domain-containing protein [unclassified Brevibacterium]MCM1012522.1 PH domain-containing protein [Brevibacterium sp. XM4083]